jgi:hypothetical protein
MCMCMCACDGCACVCVCVHVTGQVAGQGSNTQSILHNPFSLVFWRVLEAELEDDAGAGGKLLGSLAPRIYRHPGKCGVRLVPG